MAAGTFKYKYNQNTTFVQSVGVLCFDAASEDTTAKKMALGTRVW